MRYVLIFSAVLMFAVHSSAGSLDGHVTIGNDSAIVAGVKVYLVEVDRYALTNNNGNFSFQNIPQGIYTLIISCLGCSTDTVSNLRLEFSNAMKTMFVHLHEIPFPMDATVVTATRTEKQLADVPIPTSVVSRKEMTSSNAVRLDDILMEQTGVAPVSFLGTGIQLQGLDPDYTLILVDGEPVIGKRGGTLDLKRINVANIQQIEIVKGPTSALYGSDALAGVVNIITQQPHQPFAGEVSVLFSSHRSIDVSTSLETKSDKLGATMLLQRSSTNGYDLNRATPSLDAPKDISYTLAPTLTYVMTQASKFQILARSFIDKQENPTIEHASLLDWSITPKYSYVVSSVTNFVVKGYVAEYKNVENLYVNSLGSYSDREPFDQTMKKIEANIYSTMTPNVTVTAGAGYAFETVQAERIANGEQSATSSFAYAQCEWMPEHWLDLVASGRFDSHSDYASYFSPKISMMLRPVPHIVLRSSYGSGFKAPTFQQLYLDFTNPAGGGYRVFGAAGLQQRLQQEIDKGNITSVFIDPAMFQGIRPEYSIAYSGGVEVNIAEELSVQVNAFHNNVKDMIEPVTVAQLTAGPPVYSYENMDNVYTQGIESEIHVAPFDNLTIVVGYQYLEAIDRQVLSEIRAGTIFKPTPTGARRVKESEYGGLFGRSPHSGTIKILYDHRATGTSINFTWIVRDRYGDQDLNGNLILDDNSEYVPGYALANIRMSQTLYRTVIIHAGVENIFNFTNARQIPSLPGRIISCGLSYQFQ